MSTKYGSNLPFHKYPGSGRTLLGTRSTENCRHGYGLKLQQITRQGKCAYCGADLTDRYENWLTMAVDHVVPAAWAKRMSIPREWFDDYSNLVLSCAACNTFHNHYIPSDEGRPLTLNRFFDLRDSVFIQRRDMIKMRHTEEHEFYSKKPWVNPA